MKNLFITFSLLFSLIGFAQDEEYKREITTFNKIENPPIYRGCEGYKKSKDLKKCMSMKIQRHIAGHFDLGITDLLNLSAGDHKISVAFKIDTNGKVGGVKTKAEHPELEWEATRVVKSIPKMKPGMQRGEPINVLYALPIKFTISEKDVKKRKRKQKRNKS